MKRNFYQLNTKSFETKGVSNIKDLWEKVKSEGYKGLAIEVKTKFVKSESKDNKFHAIFSTANKDRHGDIVEQNWDLKQFKANPVYLDSHNYSSIERIIGKVEKIRVKDNKLIGDILFATNSPLGKLAYDLADEGFLNTSSVGFIPLQFDEKFERILKSELLEISGVSVPANPDALYEKSYDTSKKERGKIKKERGSREPEQDDDNREVFKNEKPESNNSEKIEKLITSSDRIKNAIRKELNIKEKSLQKILTAVKLINEATKGRSSNEDKASVNAKINCAVKNLLKMKIK
jgi:hypothetical protein